MLDHFLEVAIKHETDRSQSVKLAGDLKRLPNETLYGLATGRLKLAFGHCENDDWLDKYKDTPLMGEAVALEKADAAVELENEVARSQAQAASPQMDQFYRTTDQIRVQKKMLDLKLMEAVEAQGTPMQAGGQLPEQITPTAQGAGALGDVAVEGAQDGAAGKMAAALQKLALSPATIERVVGQRAKMTGLPTAHLEKLHKMVGGLASAGAGAMSDPRKTMGPGSPGSSLLTQAAALRRSLPSIKTSTVAENFRKTAFSVTTEGHKYDAESARMRERHAAEEMGRMQDANTMGHGKHIPPLGRALRFGLSDPFQHGLVTHDPRHAAYVAAKHEEGRNALNPFGGVLTPSQYEEGGTAMHYGHMGKHKKEASANFEKAALDLKGLGEGALNWAKANPGKAGALAGGALGAGVGAASAEKGHRLGGALAGAGVGAGVGGGLGHAAGGIHGHMAGSGGKGFVDAAKAYGHDTADAMGKKMKDVSSHFKKDPVEPKQTPSSVAG